MRCVGPSRSLVAVKYLTTVGSKVTRPSGSCRSLNTNSVKSVDIGCAWIVDHLHIVIECFSVIIAVLLTGVPMYDCI